MLQLPCMRVGIRRHVSASEVLGDVRAFPWVWYIFMVIVTLTFYCDLENGVKVKYSACPDFPIFRESNAILHSLLRWPVLDIYAIMWKANFDLYNVLSRSNWRKSKKVFAYACKECTQKKWWPQLFPSPFVRMWTDRRTDGRTPDEDPWQYLS